MNLLLQGDYASAPTSYQALLLALLLAFLFGQIFAWVYVITHSGVSYSRSFVVSLIVLPVLVALVLLVMSNNLVTAFGLIAVFAVIRFRNALRDTLDMCFVLSVIILGTACGTQKFSTGIVGGLAVAGLLVFLWMTASGTRHRFDLILNLRWMRSPDELAAVRHLLERHSLRVHVAHQHFGVGMEGADLSYRVLLRDPARAAELLSELAALPGVDRVSSVQAADESEI
ncbi:MAG: DUF4956 domain-containing protein [Verrucomicrobia bacterium]|nr:DUF4956 domain-containing protein [Verrucomicrobiota bacterium]